MTHLDRPYRPPSRRAMVVPFVLEYAVVFAFVVLVAALALAQVAGALDSLVDRITFVA